MQFQSLTYILFLTVFVVAGRLLRSGARGRRFLLLAASYVFYYSWSPPFLLLLVVSSLVNFSVLQWLRRQPVATALWIGVGANVFLLAYFKWGTAGVWGDRSGLLVPVGISFYTFQAISSLIDVFRGSPARPTLAEYLLYLAFWPYILSGPICRLSEMLPQFRQLSPIRGEDLKAGLSRIVTGLFQKAVLAETMARGLVPEQGILAYFERPGLSLSGLDVLLMAIGFGFYLYFDFAGYSNVAIGSGRLFGLKLRENFRDPYLATNPGEFWRRWHMSLSSWIHDYVFFPLAAAGRVGWWRYLAVLVAMVVFGSWHGLKSTFLLWGFYQGVVVVLYHATQRFRFWHTRAGGLPGFAVFGWAVTLVLTSVGWLFFAADSYRRAAMLLGRLIAFDSAWWTVSNPVFAALILAAVVGYLTVCGVRRGLSSLNHFPAAIFFWRSATPVYYGTMVLWVILWSEQASPFVYIRF